MSISINNIRLATMSEWDDIWRGCDYATYFHSREWAEIWNSYTEGKMHPDPKLVTFTDGKKALLPLSYRKTLKGMARTYISSPAGTFGGWISTDELNVEHGKLLTNYLVEELGSLVWRINPFDSNVTNIAVPNTISDITQYIDLRHGFAAIYKKWTRGHRNAANKARKAGVLVKVASSLEEWRLYYQVYEDSLRRWGDKTSSRYDWSMFSLLQRNSPNMKLWLAIFKDEVVMAGTIIFYAKKHVVAWHGAALAKYFDRRPVNGLYYEIIKNACEQQYSWFDFNPSGGHKGVRAWKKSFGAQELPSPVVHIESLSSKFIKRLYSKRRVFHRALDYEN